METMQLRASGLAGLQGLAQAGQDGGARATGTAFAEQAKRFNASDVVYDDLFRVRSQETMREEVLPAWRCRLPPSSTRQSSPRARPGRRSSSG